MFPLIGLVLGNFFIVISYTQDEPKQFQSLAFFMFPFSNLFRVSVYLNSYHAVIFWLNVFFWMF